MRREGREISMDVSSLSDVGIQLRRVPTWIGRHKHRGRRPRIRSRQIEPITQHLRDARIADLAFSLRKQRRKVRRRCGHARSYGLAVGVRKCCSRYRPSQLRTWLVGDWRSRSSTSTALARREDHMWSVSTASTTHCGESVRRCDSQAR